MPKLIKHAAIVECGRQYLPADANLDSVSTASDIVPLALWLAEKPALQARGITAVWLASDQLADPLTGDLAELELVAIQFPTFMDGRGFSSGRLLRERLGYRGEIRAFGHVIQDQLHFLWRCGFDAWDLREGTNLDSALASLKDFSEHYQAAVQQPKPLFLRRA